MTHMSDEQFRAQVEAFLARTKLSASRFGELACGDRNFVSDLREGNREFKPSTIKQALKWISGFDTGAAFVAGPTPNGNDAQAEEVRA